jgi:hypothetical protein
MDLATAARMALTAAAGHRAEERELLKGLADRQKSLIDRVFDDGTVYAILQEHFAARVLEQWGRAMEARAEENDKTPVDPTFTVPPEAKGPTK